MKPSHSAPRRRRLGRARAKTRAEAIARATKRPLQEVATAYHEAGHAVALYFFDQAPRPTAVSIIPDPDSTGRVEGHQMPLQRVFDEVGSLLAGGIAEKLATGRYNNAGALDDQIQARERAESFVTGGGRDTRRTDALLQWLWLETEALIESQWKAVDAVAKALLAKERLSWKETKEAILPFDPWAVDFARRMKERERQRRAPARKVDR